MSPHPPENPYASPATTTVALPDAPPAQGWEIRDARLWVQDGAQLPMIDPYTGGTADTMKLCQLSLRLRPPWYYLLPPAGAAIGATCYYETSALAGAATGGLTGIIACAMVLPLLPACRLRVFFLRTTVLSRRLLSAFMFLFVFGCVISPTTDEPWLKAVFGGAALILYFHSCVFQPSMRCARRRDGWFEIRGLCPAALALLIIHPATLESLSKTSDPDT
ncbi:MAG: hypothetical protein QM755_00315 [Luteolibacter sp.]